MAQVMFMKSLHMRHQPKVVAVSCMPGLSRTSIFMPEAPSLAQRIIVLLCMPFSLALMRSPFAGAQTILFCAAHPSVQGCKFYDNMAERAVTGVALCGADPAQWQRLWDYSEAAIADVHIGKAKAKAQ